MNDFIRLSIITRLEKVGNRNTSSKNGRIKILFLCRCVFFHLESFNNILIMGIFVMVEFFTGQWGVQRGLRVSTYVGEEREFYIYHRT